MHVREYFNGKGRVWISSRVPASSLHKRHNVFIARVKWSLDQDVNYCRTVASALLQGRSDGARERDGIIIKLKQ